MVVNPADGEPEMFDAYDDPLQRHDISAQHRELADSLLRRADEERRLVDYLLETNRVWQDSLSTAGAIAQAGPLVSGRSGYLAQPAYGGDDQSRSLVGVAAGERKDSIDSR